MSGVLARCHQTFTQHFHHFLGRGPALLLSRSSHRHSSPGGSSTPNEDTHLHPSVTPLCGVIKSYQATFIAPLPAKKGNKKEWDRAEEETRLMPPGDAQLMKVRDGCSVFWTGERGHCIIALHFLLCPKSQSHSVWSLLENYFVRLWLAIVTPGSAESVTRDTSRGM